MIKSEDGRAKLKRKFLEYYKELPIFRLASGKIGKDEDTVMRWRTQDKDFAEQIDILKSEWALEKIKTIKSSQWVLERVLREHFSPPKQAIEQSRTDYIHIYKPIKEPTIITDTVRITRNQTSPEVLP